MLRQGALDAAADCAIEAAGAPLRRTSGFGERHRDRRPVGRRGQGQDRRLAGQPRRRRRPLPGRPQCRPHAGGRRPDLQIVAAALGHRPRHPVGDRQRRRARSLGASGTRSRRLAEQGVSITPDNLQIADTCPLILPFHRDLDALREDASGAGKIGTTRRGIGPAYEDKVGRRAIRVCDLAHLGAARARSSTASAPITTRCAPASARRGSTAPGSSATSARSPISCCNSPARSG